MWTPNVSTAQVKLLAHKGPVSAIAHDQSSMGSYFATAGLDGSMKVWDSRNWGIVNEWHLPRPASSLCYSQKGLLASGWGHHATVGPERLLCAPIKGRLDFVLFRSMPTRHARPHEPLDLI